MEFVTEPEHLYSLGDSSHDGNINAKDATLVLRYSVGSLSENMVFCELCADYTGDGNINAKDATKILRASVGLP